MTSVSQAQMEMLSRMVNKLQGGEEDLEKNSTVIQIHRLARLRSVLHQLDEHYARQVFPKATELFQYGIRIHELSNYIRTDEDRSGWIVMLTELGQYKLDPNDWCGLYRMVEDANHTIFQTEQKEQVCTLKSLLQDVQEAGGNAKWPKAAFLAWKSVVELVVELMKLKKD